MNAGVGQGTGDEMESDSNEGGIGPNSNQKQNNAVVDFEEDPVIGTRSSPLGVNPHARQIQNHHHQ